jgi:hypothetical protein
MRSPGWALVLSSLAGITACGITGCGGGGSHDTTPPAPPPPAATGSYAVTAWSELGMHCMDGKDYSVFAVLPPYNTIHAQVIKRGDPPSIPSGVTVTYEAVADTSGSKNTSSSGKTNFWSHVQALFGANPAPDVGLAGIPVQSATPHAMTWNASSGAWDAVGIPTVPYDDAGNRNPYPMAKIVVKDVSGNLLASTTVVLAVSDELTCSTCHASGSSPAAQPAAGWENDPDPTKDMKYNILKKHDDRWNVSAYLPVLQAKGFTYQASLYQTAKAGTPILCAACHATNALGAPGVPGVNAMTADMHTLHGPLANPATGLSLDNATTSEGSCYLCHPGVQTKCQRGAMNKVACFDCHGNLTKVGAVQRQGWIDLPSCQMCHNGSARAHSTFDNTGTWRVTSDATFATNPNKPSAGKNLYKLSTGHGGLYCAACHGSQHSEYPTLQANDNLYSTGLQGYTGKIVECTVCHVTMPSTQNGGPHGMHTIGQDWVSKHHSYAGNGAAACVYCHGTDFRGTALSAVPASRSFSGDDMGTKTFPAGHQMNCYDCHNGPNGG